MTEEIAQIKWGSEQQAWWEFLLHNEDTITNRTNFFLVAQSLFAVAAITLLNDDLVFELRSSSLWLVSWGGLLVSIVWMLLGVKMYIRQGAVKKTVDKFFIAYKELLEDHDFPIGSNWVITMLIPVAFSIGWVLFLCNISHW